MYSFSVLKSEFRAFFLKIFEICSWFNLDSFPIWIIFTNVTTCQGNKTC